MAGVFPTSGVEAGQTLRSLPDGTYPLAAGCDPLWHSTQRCVPRFDPAAANAVMSEIINAATCEAAGGQEYDCNSLDNICRMLTHVIESLMPRGFRANSLGTTALPNSDVTYTEYEGSFTITNTLNGGVGQLNAANYVQIGMTGVYNVTTKASFCFNQVAGVQSEIEVGLQIVDQDANVFARQQQRIPEIFGAGPYCHTVILISALLPIGAGRQFHVEGLMASNPSGGAISALTINDIFLTFERLGDDPA